MDKSYLPISVYILILVLSFEFMSWMNSDLIKVMYVSTMLYLIGIKKNPISINKLIVFSTSLYVINIIAHNIVTWDAIQEIGYFFIVFYTLFYLIDRIPIIAFYMELRKIVLVLALFSIFQEVVYIYDDIILYSPQDVPATIMIGDYRILRVNSLFHEPGHFGLFLLPFLIIEFQNKDSNYRFNSRLTNYLMLYTITIALVLTFSSIAYIFIMIGVLYSIFSIKKNKLFGVVLMLAVFTATTLNFYVLDKIQAIFNPDLYMQGGVAASSFVVYLGIQGMYHTLLSSPIFGFGYGEYASAVSGFIDGYRTLASYHSFEDTGTSFKFAKIFVEIGLVGILPFLYFLYAFRLPNNSFYGLINNSVLLTIIAISFRLGHTVYPMFLFFCAIYMVSFYKWEKTGVK